MGACHCRDKLIIYTIIMHMYFCTCSSSKNNYKFAMFTFSVLVNCSSLENLVKVMETCKILFCSKSIDDGVTKSFNRLVKWFGELEDLPLLDNNEAPWCRCLGGIACILHTGHALTVNTQQLHTATCTPSADDDCNRFIKYNGHTSWQK